MRLCADEYSDLLRNPDMPFETSLANLKDIAAEVMDQAPILLSDAGKAPDPVTTGGGHPWLMTRAQWTDDKDRLYVLIAVSDGDGHGTVTFDLSNSTAFGCTSKLIVVRVMEPDPRAGKLAPLPVVSGCTFTDNLPLMAAVGYNISFETTGGADGLATREKQPAELGRGTVDAFGSPSFSGVRSPLTDAVKTDDAITRKKNPGLPVMPATEVFRDEQHRDFPYFRGQETPRDPTDTSSSV